MLRGTDGNIGHLNVAWSLSASEEDMDHSTTLPCRRIMEIIFLVC